MRTYLKLWFIKALAAVRELVIGRYASAILVESSNGQFLVDAKDLGVARSLLYKGVYGQDLLDIIVPYLKNSDIIGVVGTHVGTLVVPLSKRVDFVYGYEANPRNYQLLQLNLMLNDVNNVNIKNLACGDEKGELPFLMNVLNSGGSKFKPKIHQFKYEFDSPNEIKVPVVSVDDDLDVTPDVWIIDVEGAETMVLKGGINHWNESRLLLIEFVPHHLKDVAGVSPNVFAQLLINRFEWWFVAGEAEKRPINSLERELVEMYNRGFACDLLLGKQ
jgi:FkbM family methyltransferase